ncbi:30S ribosomal protein THX [Pseudomarimonas arenosa]|uniref:30S ribosomal protein THX n=1 Tax=Pseudomarimonas arenosa TaxID=2774145 RepID=A0AAW3ZQI5_9GAMM|nr:30S ribosomal protein THX [Pseudomarimonas arenosa]MBD8527185.1 30S ribosomal protein THX [Pseudomarimonas arenosa]
MGKGDKKTFRGKVFAGSYGNARTAGVKIGSATPKAAVAKKAPAKKAPAKKA